MEGREVEEREKGAVGSGTEGAGEEGAASTVKPPGARIVATRAEMWQVDLYCEICQRPMTKRSAPLGFNLFPDIKLYRCENGHEHASRDDYPSYEWRPVHDPLLNFEDGEPVCNPWRVKEWAAKQREADSSLSHPQGDMNAPESTAPSTNDDGASGTRIEEDGK